MDTPQIAQHIEMQRRGLQRFRAALAQPVEMANGPTVSECLLLQGRPIGEPVAKQGPFVMNTDEEVRQAFADYRRTGFGGWPWDADDPNHGPDAGRFARHADGRVEQIDPAPASTST